MEANQASLNSMVAQAKKRKRPCCVCKMTKKMRDDCIRINAEMKCIDFI